MMRGKDEAAGLLFSYVDLESVFRHGTRCV
jgi:hypothetical protein